ncbi:MAG: MFS transporter [Spirochaetaceae bacterium]|jgi:DHA3 family macrolide efflux protein-like MFS transporter|nr:MFS transporter [Spirochaetaceae bacterium]
METRNGQNNHWKRNFYTIAAGQAVSYVGSSAVQFALIWWLTKETGSALMLSLAGIFAALPQTVLGPFAGVWVDRLKRKTVMIAADLFTGFVALAFAGAFFLGTPPYWAACAVLGIRAIGGVFHYPALAAAMPLLVPREELVRANSVNQFIFMGSFMLGPVIGAAMFAALPMEVILILDLAGALAACFTVGIIKIPELSREVHEKKHFWREMKEGVFVFLENKKLFLLTVFSTIVFVFIMPLSSLYPLMVTSFGGTEWHLSIVQIVYGAGMLAGAGITGGLGSRIKNKIGFSMSGLFIYSLTAFLCGIVPPNMTGLLLFGGICFVMGTGNNIYSIPLTAYMQETIPNEKQGRAFSLYSCLMSVAMPLGLIIAGPVAEYFGVAFFFIIAGLVSLVISAVCALVIRKHTA